jgi:hypothetical protein
MMIAMFQFDIFSCIFGISPKCIFEGGHKVATNVDIIVNKYFLGVFL